jgi:hypothetical protein
MTDLKPAIRAAILAQPDITNYLSQWNNEPAVFTRRPVPTDAQFPMIVVSPNIAYGNEDALNKERGVITLDIIAYGRVAAPGTPEDHTRGVEAIGELLREVFHRQRWSLGNTPYHVISINVTGPFVAPTDSESVVARATTLIVRIE